MKVFLKIFPQFIPLILMTLACLSAGQSHADTPSPEEPNPKINSSIESPEIFKAPIDELETLLAQGRLDGKDGALKKAIALLSQVSKALTMTSGKGPNYFVIPEADKEFFSRWEKDMIYERAGIRVQNIATKLIRDAQEKKHYIDALNAFKRIQLLYAKSFFRHYKTTQLRIVDIDHLKTTLLSAWSIPLYFANDAAKPSVVKIAFDDEVIDTVLQYDFDREILEFALTELKNELKWEDKDFFAALDQYKAGLRKTALE